MSVRRKNRYVSYYDASISDETLDNELASHTSDGLMSKEDKLKLDALNTDGSVDVKASNVITDSENMFVSEEQIAKWDEASEHAVTYDHKRQALVIKI